MLEKLTYGTFIFFGALTFGGGLFILLFVPETKQLTLEQMDLIFGSVGVAEAVSILSSSAGGWFACFKLLEILAD